MAQRRNRFAPPTQPARRRTLRTEIVEPGGINTAEQEINLRPGEAPFSQNFVVEDGWLRPRSQLTAFDNSGSTISDSNTLQGMFYSDNQDATRGDVFAVVGGTVYRHPAEPDVGSWTSASTTTSPGPSGRVSGAAVYHVQSEQPFLFLSADSGSNPPAKVAISNSAHTVSALTEAFSLLSSAAHVASFDDRLIFFNTESNGNRVVWSARGDPLDFDNGGFEDLISMREQGTGIMPSGDRMLLFSHNELWEARPRRDDFAFDFDQLVDDVGTPYSSTIVSTPAGVIWVSYDFTIYLLRGSEAIPIGQKVHKFLKDRIDPKITDFKDIHAVYDLRSRSYLLFFSTTTATPTHMLALDTDSLGSRRGPTFTHHVFDGETNGSGINAATKYFQRQETADFQSDWYTAFGSDSGNTINFFIYSHNSSVVGDSNFTSQWRSHAFRPRRESTAYEEISEFYVHYEADSAATLNISTSTDLGSNFVSAGTATLPAGDHEAYLSVSVPATRHPMFQLQTTGDDTSSRVRLGRVEVTLRQYTGRRAGAR